MTDVYKISSTITLDQDIQAGYQTFLQNNKSALPNKYVITGITGHVCMPVILCQYDSFPKSKLYIVIECDDPVKTFMDGLLISTLCAGIDQDGNRLYSYDYDILDYLFQNRKYTVFEPSISCTYWSITYGHTNFASVLSTLINSSFTYIQGGIRVAYLCDRISRSEEYSSPNYKPTAGSYLLRNISTLTLLSKKNIPFDICQYICRFVGNISMNDIHEEHRQSYYKTAVYKPEQDRKNMDLGSSELPRNINNLVSEISEYIAEYWDTTLTNPTMRTLFNLPNTVVFGDINRILIDRYFGNTPELLVPSCVTLRVAYKDLIENNIIVMHRNAKNIANLLAKKINPISRFIHHNNRVSVTFQEHTYEIYIEKQKGPRYPKIILCNASEWSHAKHRLCISRKILRMIRDRKIVISGNMERCHVDDVISHCGQMLSNGYQITNVKIDTKTNLYAYLENQLLGWLCYGTPPDKNDFLHKKLERYNDMKEFIILGYLTNFKGDLSLYLYSEEIRIYTYVKALLEIIRTIRNINKREILKYYIKAIDLPEPYKTKIIRVLSQDAESDKKSKSYIYSMYSSSEYSISDSDYSDSY